MTPTERDGLVANIKFLRTRLAAEALFDVVTVLERVYTKTSPILKSLTDVSVKPSTTETWAEAHSLINPKTLEQMHGIMGLQTEDVVFQKPTQPIRTVTRNVARLVVNRVEHYHHAVSNKTFKYSHAPAHIGGLVGYLYQVFNPCLSTWEDDQSMDVEYRMLMDLTGSGGIFLGFRMLSNPNTLNSNTWWERAVSEFTASNPTGNEPSVMRQLEGLDLHEMYDDYLEGTGIRCQPSRFNNWYNALCNSISELLVGVFLRTA